MITLALGDAALLMSSYNLLFWRQFERWPGITGSIALTTAIWLVASYLLGRYSVDLPRRIESVPNRITKTITTGALVLIGVVIADWGLEANDPRALRSFLLIVLGMTCAGSSVAQEIGRRKEARKKSWLVIASKAEKKILQEELETDPPSDEVMVCFNTRSDDPDKWKNDLIINQGFVLSDAEDIEDEVIEVLLSRKSQGTAVCGLTTWCESVLNRIPPEILSTRALAQAEGFGLQPGQTKWRIKRLGDLLLGSILLVTLSPIMIFAALAILIDDGGPVLYSQIRTGLYGQVFRIWKLRTMRVDAEGQGPQWSSNGDRRITRVGRWLRQARIDELPQLISVIRGEMSLIGPRPERPDIEKILEREISHYRVRHWVRPGLSGWAQVCFPYGASVRDSRSKLSYDLYYLRNAGIGLDFLILLKTLRLIAFRDGAIARATSRAGEKELQVED